MIVASPDGAVTYAKKVELTDPPKGLAISISRAQGGYFFKNSGLFDQRLASLTNAVKATGVQDFAILRCDFHGSNPFVIYPHALYLCFSSPFRTLSKAEIATLKCKIVWDDELDDPDDNFLCAVNASSGSLCDTFEIGYPEKLTSLEGTWKVSVAAREGRLTQGQFVLTNDDLVGLAKMIEGGVHYYYEKISSPRLRAAWEKMLADLRLPLLGNRHWQKLVPVLLEQIKIEAPQATVSISLYNPCNLLLSLYYVAWRSDYSRCANFEICVENEDKKEFRVFMSSLAWNGNPVLKSPERMVVYIYQNFERWCSNSTEFEDRAMLEHNISTPVVEFQFYKHAEPTAREVCFESKKLVFKPLRNESLPAFKKFESENRVYLIELKRYLERFSSGLPGSELNLSN